MTLLAALATAPAALAAAAPAPDWLETFTGASPLCAQQLNGSAAANCHATARVETPFPVDHYQFDTHISTGLTHWQNDVAALIQWLASLCWTVTLTALEIVLAVLQWAFSLDILHAALAPLRETLTRLHDDVLGPPWQLIAIGILALGALYHGLVRGDLAESIGGTALAIVLVGVGVYIIEQPVETLGPFSALANEAGGGFLAGAATGQAGQPDQGVADASETIFDTAVTRPWCAIEFGDVGFCLSRAPGGETWAQRWLRYGPGTPQREAEYDALAGNPLPGANANPLTCLTCTTLGAIPYAHQVAGIHRDPARVAFQTEPATVFRAAIVIVMCAGLWCCILLTGWLTALLMVQSIVELALVLAAPALCLAPAFGRRGRAAFTRWLALLAFTVVGRAIYAFALAIVICVTAVLARVASTLPYGIGWALETGAWLIAYKRRDALLLQLTGPGHRSAELRALLAVGRGAAPVAIAGAGLALRAPRRAGRLAAGPVDSAVAWAGARGREHGSQRGQRAAQRTATRWRAESASALERRLEQDRARLGAHDRAAGRRSEIDRTLALAAAQRARLQAQLGVPGDPKHQLALAGRLHALQHRDGELAAERERLAELLLDADEASSLRARLDSAEPGQAAGVSAVASAGAALPTGGGAGAQSPASTVTASSGAPAGTGVTRAFGAAAGADTAERIAAVQAQRIARNRPRPERPGANVPILPPPPRQLAARAQIDATLARDAESARRAAARRKARRAEQRALRAQQTLWPTDEGGGSDASKDSGDPAL